MLRFVLTVSFLTLLPPLSSASGSSLTDRIEWTEQFGTPGFDIGGDATADDAFGYVTGSVPLALPGQVHAGFTDVYVRKYATDGSIAWTRQLGTAGFDQRGRVVEQDGTLYLAGWTDDTFPGQIKTGILDIFFAAFDTDGNHIYTRQWGTAGFDLPLGIAADALGVYVFGLTTGTFPGEVSQGSADFFLARLTFGGDVAWVRQFGTSAFDPAFFLLGGVAVDDTGIYVSSAVAGVLPGQLALGNDDAFVAKFLHDGTLLWTDQFGTGCSDLGTGVAVHDGYVSVVGTSLGDLTGSPSAKCRQPPEAFRNQGAAARAFVQLRNPDGEVLWTRQFEGNGFVEGNRFSLPIDVAADADGIFVASEFARPPTPDTLQTDCPITGGQEDTHIRAYDFDGSEQWTQVIGSTGRDTPGGIALLAESVQVVGTTDCALAGEMNAGLNDAFVIQVAK